MALKKNITAALDAKKVELTNTAARAKETAEFHRSQIAGAEAEAALSTMQAKAVTEALAILANAGVTV